VVGLQGLLGPQYAIDDWGRVCYELTEQDLETAGEGDLALASDIRRKLPGGWAVHWGWL
jgi:hypothetical protein